MTNKGMFDEAKDADEKQIGGNHRSEEHTSELQSRLQIVCRLLLGKKNKKKTTKNRKKKV